MARHYPSCCLVAGLVLAAAFAQPVRAQTHFADCISGTGNNAILIFPSTAAPTVDEAPLSLGSEIAVFTPDGTCAGVLIWDGVNTYMTMWGADDLSGKGGFKEKDLLTFRAWDKATDEEYGDAANPVAITYADSEPYYVTDGLYYENGIYLVDSFTGMTGSGTGTDGPDNTGSLLLEQNVPNPFSRSTRIAYTLAEPSHAQLEIVDVQGRSVRTVFSGVQSAGRHEVVFDASGLLSGLYVYRLTAGDQSRSRRMILIN